MAEKIRPIELIFKAVGRQAIQDALRQTGRETKQMADESKAAVEGVGSAWNKTISDLRKVEAEQKKLAEEAKRAGEAVKTSATGASSAWTPYISELKKAEAEQKRLAEEARRTAATAKEAAISASAAVVAAKGEEKTAAREAAKEARIAANQAAEAARIQERAYRSAASAASDVQRIQAGINRQRAQEDRQARISASQAAEAAHREESRAAAKDLRDSQRAQDQINRQNALAQKEEQKAKDRADQDAARTAAMASRSPLLHMGDALRDTSKNQDYQAWGGLRDQGLRLTATAAVGGATIAAGLNAADQERKYLKSFTAMLGSESASKQMLDELKKFDRRSPFNYQETVQNARFLMNNGVGRGDVMPVMEGLGNAVALGGGGADEFNRAAYAYGQVQGFKKFRAAEGMQFVQAGIPIYDILKAGGGYSDQQIAAIRKGEMELSSTDFQKAFVKGTTSGKFKGAMEGANDSLSGSLSGVQSAFTQLAASIQDHILPAVNSFLRATTGVLDFFNGLPEPLKAIGAWGGLIGVSVVGLAGLGMSLLGTVGQAITGFKLVRGALVAARTASFAAAIAEDAEAAATGRKAIAAEGAAVAETTQAGATAIAGGASIIIGGSMLALAGAALLAAAAVGIAFWSFKHNEDKLRSQVNTVEDKRSSEQVKQDNNSGAAVAKAVKESEGLGARDRLAVLTAAQGKYADLGMYDEKQALQEETDKLRRQFKGKTYKEISQAQTNFGKSLVAEITGQKGTDKKDLNANNENFHGFGHYGNQDPAEAAKQAQSDDLKKLIDQMSQNAGKPVSPAAVAAVGAPGIPGAASGAAVTGEGSGMAPTGVLSPSGQVLSQQELWAMEDRKNPYASQIETLKRQKSGLKGKQNKDARDALTSQIADLQTASKHWNEQHSTEVKNARRMRQDAARAAREADKEARADSKDAANEKKSSIEAKYKAVIAKLEVERDQARADHDKAAVKALEGQIARAKANRDREKGLVDAGLAHDPDSARRAVDAKWRGETAAANIKGGQAGAVNSLLSALMGGASLSGKSSVLGVASADMAASGSMFVPGMGSARPGADLMGQIASRVAPIVNGAQGGFINVIAGGVTAPGSVASGIDESGITGGGKAPTVKQQIEAEIAKITATGPNEIEVLFKPFKVATNAISNHRGLIRGIG